MATNTDKIGNYNLDAKLQTLGEQTVTFHGKTFKVNRKYKNLKRAQEALADVPTSDAEKIARTFVEFMLGDAALAHFDDVLEDMDIDMIGYLAMYIPAAASRVSMEEMERRFQVQSD